MQAVYCGQAFGGPKDGQMIASPLPRDPVLRRVADTDDETTWECVGQYQWRQGRWIYQWTVEKS